MQQTNAKAYAELCAILGIPADSASNETQQADNNQERRRHARQKCSYIVVGKTGFRQGTIGNISQSGFLICGRHQVDLNQQLTILIEPSQANLLPFRVRATVVREAEMTKNGNHCYGCIINSITNPNNYKG